MQPLMATNSSSMSATFHGDRDGVTRKMALEEPRAAQKRTLDQTWQYLGNLVPSLQRDECSNYFANAGYASVKT